MARYRIVSIDNGSLGASTASTKRGEFDDVEAAIACAQELVDKALQEHLAAANDAHELMAHYMRDGSEVPQIFGEPRADFHAYQYARRRSEELFRE